jgi:FtsP/CotA-like multicopper oxidase with cupredoxin domain
MLSRRDLVKLGLAGTPYILLPYDRAYAQVPPSFVDNNFQSPPHEPWAAELPIPDEPVPVGAPFSDPPLSTEATHAYGKYIDANTQFFDISAEQRSARFHPSWDPTPVWGYRDLNPDANPASVLGPTFRMRTFGRQPVGAGGPLGGRMLVRHRNNLPKNHVGFGQAYTTVHLHGAHLQPRADGFPDDLAAPPPGFPARIVSAPGEFHDHAYPLFDPGFETDLAAGVEHLDTAESPSTLWYHDHFLEFTAQNVYRGLAGFFLVFDRAEPTEDKTAYDIDDEQTARDLYAKDQRFLPLPSGPFDIPLVLQDRRFAPDYSLVYSSFDHRGFLGDKFLVNGAIQPKLRVQQRKYRFRFLNGSNARIYQVFLCSANGAQRPMDMIATEGGLLSAPIRNISNFSLAMAERIEVVVDFSKYPVGTELFIENRRRQTRGEQPDGIASRGPQLLKFIVEPMPPGEEDASFVPDVLRPFDPISPQELAEARVRTKTFDFDEDHGNWVINDRLAGDLRRPITTSRLGRGEIWRLKNDDDRWWHPIHIHSDYFRVLSRNGKVPPLWERDGRAKKDTILLRDDEVVEIFVKFTDHTGPWVFHCHNLEHEDMAMMARFDTVMP